MLHGAMNMGFLPAVFTMRLPVFVKRSADTHEQRCAACSFEASVGCIEGAVMLADISSNENVKTEIQHRVNNTDQSYVNCQGAPATEK